MKHNKRTLILKLLIVLMFSQYFAYSQEVAEKNIQVLTKLAVKCGPSLSGQSNSFNLPEDRGVKLGNSGTIEPTILTFGAKKQFDFNIDISFIQKGGHIKPIYIYSVFSEGDLGTLTYPVTINYFSCSPSIKIVFLKFMFAKIGPRLDVFSNASCRRFAPEFSKFKPALSFNSLTYGITYALGVSVGKNRRKFICEFLGQNDFTRSVYYKAVGQKFTNFSYILNFGVVFILKTAA